jgi:hypothetical protein
MKTMITSKPQINKNPNNTMSSTRTYPKPDPTGKFLVIPFNLAYSPFLTSEPFTPGCDDCAVIFFETLLEIQNQLEALKDEYFQTLKKIITRHEILKKKLIKKPMKGFGLGAFASAEIEERELIIYAGNILYGEKDTQKKSNVYGLQSETLPELSFDAGFSNTLAKFFQHLPAKPNLSIKDESPALRNFESLTLISEIIYKKQTLLIPVPIFYACKKIPEGHIVGIDYQVGYWNFRARPTHFKADGTPIPDYYITTQMNDYGNRDSCNGYNKKTIDLFPQRQFLLDKSGIIFLPKPSARALTNFMNQLPDKHGSQAIILPYILIIIFNPQINFSVTLTEEPVVMISLIFELTKSETKLLPKYLHQIHDRGKPYLLLLLNELKEASITEISSLTSYLGDFYGNDNFFLTESQIYKDLTSPPPATRDSPKESDLQTPQLLYSINPTPLFRKYKTPVRTLVIEQEENPRRRL